MLELSSLGAKVLHTRFTVSFKVQCKSSGSVKFYRKERNYVNKEKHEFRKTNN